MTDGFVQLLFLFFPLLGIGFFRRSKELWTVVEQLLLPCGYLLGMDVVFSGKFRDLFLSLNGLYRHLELEILSSTCFLFHLTLFFKWTSNLVCCPVFRVHYREITNQYLVGKTGDLEIEIRSVFGSNAAFVAKLSNTSSTDVELNSISDKIYFIGSDGMQVEGELVFYYSDYFRGNYPDFISANTFIAFNIETKQAVNLSESKAAYQIDSNNTRLKLLPNKDTRKIKDVRLE